MKLDIVTPERQLVSTDVESVQIPGMEGDMTVMENHAPLVTTLRPGIVSVTGGDGGEYFVTGGFAEISAAGTSILAERAVPRADVNRDMLEALLKDATEAAETASDDLKTAAALRVNDVSELIKQIG